MNIRPVGTESFHVDRKRDRRTDGCFFLILSSEKYYARSAGHGAFHCEISSSLLFPLLSQKHLYSLAPYILPPSACVPASVGDTAFTPIKATENINFLQILTFTLWESKHEDKIFWAYGSRQIPKFNLLLILHVRSFYTYSYFQIF